MLRQKSDPARQGRVFRKLVRDMIAVDHLTDYLTFEEPGEIIRSTRRGQVVGGPDRPPEALESARKLSPGWDVYAPEAGWLTYWRA